jgi:hypothetical protein
MITPLAEKAMKNIKINGYKFESMEGKLLKPNDRVCIGPSAIFLYKHKQKETDDTKPDTEDEPISFDDASEEVYEVENADEKKL